MATVVLHIATEKNYLLLGTGYGMWATDKPGFLGFEDRNDGHDSAIFVCDASGQIGQFPAGELVVVSVDGRPVADHLDAPPTGSLT